MCKQIIILQYDKYNKIFTRISKEQKTLEGGGGPGSLMEQANPEASFTKWTQEKCMRSR